MCGIAGIFNRYTKQPVEKKKLQPMIDSLRHRGPDDVGFYHSANVGFGQSRLSIIDLSGGQQPIYNEDKSIVVVFNGEIFNYPELTDQLKKKGHSFYTKSDTEVIVHAYEEYGIDFLQHLNGQFAIALWDNRDKRLVLARDRVGIRPLFYAFSENGNIIFASEMKSIFCNPSVIPEIDPAGLNQVFTLWVNIPPRTIFKNINELPPGHFLIASEDSINMKPYWKLQYPGINDYETKSLDYYQEKLKDLLFDSIAIRLRADVPVASYLSGGIDSSIISTIVKRQHNNSLKTFSVAFSDSGFDERKYQLMMADHLQTEHKTIEATYQNIGKLFPDVIWFAEKPVIRTAPAPLYLLSDLVRRDNIKVVLTGEGADEVFGGYNIFKEDKVRRFWAKFPDSKYRPLLLSKLYPYITNNHGQSQSFWQLFFKKNLNDIDNPFYSHMIRWHNTAQIKKFFNKEIQQNFDDGQIYEELNQYIDKDIVKWHPYARAQYLEMQLFMSGYLLSSQGDRMMMGHSVEGRFPFLDHRLIEFANAMPPEYKMNVLNEKYILKKTFKDILPDTIIHRAKQPYRAPIYKCFTQKSDTLSAQMLNADSIIKTAYFNPIMVERLVKKAEQAEGQTLSAREDMALVGIVSLNLLHMHFIERETDYLNQN